AAGGDWVELRYESLTSPEAAEFGGVVITAQPVHDRHLSHRDLRARLHDDDRLVRLSAILLRRGVGQFDEGLEEAVQELSAIKWTTRISVWSFVGETAHQRAAWSAAADVPA